MATTIDRVVDEILLPASPPRAIDATAARADRYTVHVVTSLDELSARLHGLVGDALVAVVTDETVHGLYGGTLQRSLPGARVHVVPAGESTKSVPQAVALWDWLAGSDIARRDVLVAFGGGVICDLTGWVASAYMRGLPYVNLPTTLLAMVDGALGGKVAVNHPSAKNLLGAFHQPRGVISDVSFLRTLERRHLAAGLAEAIKKAVIASSEYFALIERDVDAILDRDVDSLRTLVAFAAMIKTELVGRDPYEADLRRPLNFGHTIGHPLETVTGYGPLLHGEAVAFGMVVESLVAHARGLLDDETLGRLVALLRRAGLPTHARELPVAASGRAIQAAMSKVRQIRAGSLRFVLPAALGVTLIADDVTEAEVGRALAKCGVGR
jgi:3-dehydroquinate synthase